MSCLRSHPHDADESCDGSVRHLYAKGVHDERERILSAIRAKHGRDWENTIRETIGLPRLY